MEKILEYKHLIRRGKIPDFRPVCDILDKISWFHQYPYVERQQLVNQSQLRLYAPDEKIFSQGQNSPCLYILIFGTVKAVMTKGEWGPDVKVLLSMFFDGQIFGEMSDYEAQKDQISTRMLKELQMQKYSAYA